MANDWESNEIETDFAFEGMALDLRKLTEIAHETGGRSLRGREADLMAAKHQVETLLKYLREAERC